MINKLVTGGSLLGAKRAPHATIEIAPDFFRVKLRRTLQIKRELSALKQLRDFFKEITNSLNEEVKNMETGYGQKAEDM